MIRLIRVELLKIRSTRLVYGLLATAAGLTALFSVIEASSAGGSGQYAPPPLYTAAGFSGVVNAGIWSLVLAAVLGATVSTGEFRHRTATLTYLAAPGRGRVLAAKAAAGALCGAVFGLTGFAVSLGAGLGFTASDGYAVPLGDATMARYGAGALLAAALLAAVGVALGALVRHQLGAVIAVFAWTIIIESVIGGLYTSVRPYLPFTAATTMAGSALGGAAFGPAHNVPGGTPLPFLAAAALLAALAAAGAAAAAVTTVRRDIT
jgi:ABC-type transport system involved in multi-copper enzyme maturation permease subunit